MTALLTKVKDKKEDAHGSVDHDGLVLKDRIRHLRKALGLSQTDLAKAAGVTQSAISWIERGDTQSLRGDTLMRLAAALGEDPEYLRTGKRAAERPPLTELEAAAAIYRSLSAASRTLWLEIGKKLQEQHPEPARTLHNADRGEVVVKKQHQNRIAAEVLNQLTAILEQHGPDAFARALDYIQGATSHPPEPHPTPRKTKHRT